MKILIGSLLFATAILINFPELNSSPQLSSRASSSRRRSNVASSRPEVEVCDRTYIEVLGKKIGVDLAKIDNEYVAVVCRIRIPDVSIPTRNTRKTCNFMTKAAFKEHEGSLIRIVVYIEEDKYKIQRLLGAKLPPSGKERFQYDEPKLLDPDKSKWFITYDVIDYVVEVEPASGNYIGVSLYGQPNLRPDHEEIIKNWHHYPVTHFGGVYFFVFRNYLNVVVGAALDPLWKYRPGEEFAHLNPYLNHQQNPLLNYPIGLNPGHQQILDQQHHLGQQQNLNPYQNLYQNPYPYPHQTLDPNEQYVHQGAYQTPHLAPNQNWDYQNYNPNP